MGVLLWQCPFVVDCDALFPSKTLQGDLNEDGQLETYDLNFGRLVIVEDVDGFSWESPDEWWVQDVVLGDSTGDGILDLNLSVWKSGSFGPSQPFWIEENDSSVKNHFFIFDLLPTDELQTVWQSSNLDAPNCTIALTDENRDGRFELLVTEGDYADGLPCRARATAGWEWNGWGFSNEWREVI